MIKRILLVATREFTTTIKAKGFLIGVLLVPILVLVILTVAPRLLNVRNPVLSGQMEVIDPTGAVTAELHRALEPSAIVARRAQGGGAEPGTGRTPGAGAGAGPVPNITLIEKPPVNDLASEKQWLIQQGKPDVLHLALVLLHPNAVTQLPGRADSRAYDLYLAARVDTATQTIIHAALRDALIAARLKDHGIDQRVVEASMRVPRPSAVVVTRDGERPAREGAAFLLPVLCGVLLFIGVMMGGQTLLTSTIEEKSSRVVEVLLAAVSPIELMSGKLIGQLAVSLLTIVVYLGLATLALSQYSMSGLLDKSMVLYFIVFYVLAYLVYGGLMLAIGAAVSQAAEAQSLMGPVMLLLIAPYVLVPMIGQAPNSPLSIAMSFVPPINSFAILARLASGTPPAFWQVLVSMLAGLLGAALAVWFAAKIFRIALLMHGKPPNFVTLIRWARMA